MHQDDLTLRIRVARQLARRSQAELAQALGIGRSAVANWECGRAHPSTARLTRLARATGVTFEWLATGQGAMKPESASKANAAGALSHEEDVLLQSFRAASQKRQQQILYVAMSLSATTIGALADLLALGGG